MAEKKIAWTKKDLLGLEYLSKEEIELILYTAASFQRSQRPASKESSRPARQDSRKLVLRAVDEDAHIVRACGKKAFSRRRQRGDRNIERAQRRNAYRHRQKYRSA